MSGLTRFSARWILPVTGAPIERGALLVDSGRIAEVGRDADVTSPESAEVVDLGDAVLLPGLVNVHAHPELSILRGALEDLPFHLWIPQLRRIKAALGCTDDDWRDAARWSCVEAAAAGITTMAATEDSDASLHALRDAGMRGIAFREVFGPAPESAGDAIALLRRSVDAMRALDTDLVRTGISPHAPYTVSDQLFAEAAAYARSESLRVAIHIAESEAEHLLVTQGAGPFAAGLRTRGIDTPARSASPVALLEAAGILELAPLLIHCVRIDSADIERIRSSGSAVAHCPVANARLGHGVAPIAALLESGAVVGIGTDSVASNNRMDLLEEARIAQLVQRAALLSAGALPAGRLLELVTIEGARALALADRVGSLEPGKDADLCAVRLSGAHMQPAFDPVAALFMSARGSDVVRTVVRGRTIYRDGVHLALDPAALRPRIAELGSRVQTAARQTSQTSR